MNREFPRSLLGGGDVGFLRTSIATSFTRPFTRISTNSDQDRVLIDVGPENCSNEEDVDDDDDGGDDSLAPLSRDCGYSRPFLFLDMIWNLAFVVVSVFVLLVTVRERPSTPLRLWVCGYALQCLLHVGFVWDEYQRRNLDDGDDGGGGGECCFPRGVLCSAFCQNR